MILKISYIFNSILLRNKKKFGRWGERRIWGCEGWTDFCLFFVFFAFFIFFYTELNRKSRENIGAVRKAADKVSNSAGRFPSM